MRYSNLATLAAFALALTGNALSAQQQDQQQTPKPTPMSFQEVDQDGDRSIDKDEFYAYMGEAGIYGDLDRDNDGFIDEGELEAIGFEEGFAPFHAWDADLNTYIDATEFYDGVYAGYDGDGSGHWDADEWDDAGEEGFLDF